MPQRRRSTSNRRGRPPVPSPDTTSKDGNPAPVDSIPLHPWENLCHHGVSRYKRHLLDSLDSFAPGGGCPIHLHDELDKGRYRVIHRLGRGGYGVVWLCRDLKSEKPQYVAVKILWAEETERVANEKFCVERIKRLCADEPDLDRYLCLPTRDFFAKSANGRHICLVYPVLGPKASMAREIFKPRYNDYCKRLRDISRDCIKALDLLHRRNICHADFRPGNILLEMDSLDGLEEEEVLKRLGEPKTVRVRSKFDGRLKHDVPHAPQYLVFPVDFRNVDAGLIYPRARVIDFGRVVDLAITRPRVCIPTAYKAPEAVFDNDSSTAIDMWSLGCTLYEIRFGRRFFHWRHDEDKRSYNCAYLDMLGPVLGMPPGDWGMYYGSREEISPGVRNPSPVPQGEEERHRSIMRELRTCSDCHNALRHDCMCIGPEPVFVSRPEAVALADLLGRLLRYQWQYRPHPARILNHYWFTTQFADP